MDKDTGSKYLKFSDTDWKKVKSETFEYLEQQNMAALKSMCFDFFQDRDLTSRDGEREKDCIAAHDSRHLEIPWQSHSWEIQVWEGKSLNNQDLMFQSRNVEGKII